MIRRTITASALFVAMATAGADEASVELLEERLASVPTQPSSVHVSRSPGAVLFPRLLPTWQQRFDGVRTWIRTAERGEHLALWHRAGPVPESAALLHDFAPGFAPCSSAPTELGRLPAERTIGKSVLADGTTTVAVVVVAPLVHSPGAIILASRGPDHDLPGRFRDLLVLSTYL